MSEFDLITAAMEGVAVVRCERCRGDGEVGAPTLRITCPQCRGCGRTTTNQLEVRSEADA